MTDFPKICPNCSERYEWYVAECPNCHVALVSADSEPVPDQPLSAEDQAPSTADQAPGSEGRTDPTPDASLVVVFNATEAGPLALAQLALDDASIPYGVHTVGAKWILGLPARQAWLPGSEVPAQIVVGSDQADKARAILADLETSQSPQSAYGALTSATGRGPISRMPDVQLHNADTNQPLGEITKDELQFLFDRLERESDSDDDFYIDASTLEMLEDAKAPQHLLDVLRQAVGSAEGVEVKWTRT